jgi:hypothetical protein
LSVFYVFSFIIFIVFAENNQRIKGNEENVRECVWMLDGIWLVHLNHYSVFGIKRNVWG